VLIIEDNPANLELMRYLLDAFAYSALVAIDGEQGVAMAAAEKPDLILCDVQMPEIDGYEVLRRIRGHSATVAIPVVAVTALAMVGDRAKVLAAGFDGYLSKPIDPTTFVQQVESFLPPALRKGRSRPVADLEASGTRRALRGPTILAVDDVQVNLDLVASIFEPRGYRVLATLDAREALRLARDSPPDLILSDVCMPDGGGFELIRAVKADPRLSAIPFVFLTSTRTDEGARQEGLALGAAKFLFRPIEAQALMDEIVECLPEGGGA
jgi:two-component system cell cycle response regulator